MDQNLTFATDDTPTVLGIDLGGGALKLWGPAGGVELPNQIAALTATRPTARAAGLTRKRPPLIVQLDGTGFYVGPRAHDKGRPLENLGDDRFEGSPEVTALLYGGLSTYAKKYTPQDQGDPPVNLDHLDAVVGLTQSAMGIDGIGASVRRWLTGDHHWVAHHPITTTRTQQVDSVVTVDGVAVTTQAAGAVFDYFLDLGGGFVPERKGSFKEEIGIVSVGMNTLELLVLRKGSPVDRFVASETAGVRRLLELVDPRGLYSRGELDAKLREGSLYIPDHLPVWSAEILGHVERVWGSAYMRFAKVIVVGGGVLLLGQRLTAGLNGKAFVPDEPILSVSRGLYKLGTQRANRAARKSQGTR